MTEARNLSLRILAIAIVLMTVVIRIPLLIHPHSVDDESVYSLVGNEIADGGRPYIDAVERKPPLLFWTYAAIVKIGGKYNWPFLHAVVVLWVLATMAGLYVLGRRLFDPLTGLFAALFYSLYQSRAKFSDFAFNGEIVMNLPIVWAWAIALSKSRSRLRPELFISGMLMACAFLLKQPAAIAAVPLGIYLLLPAYQRDRGITFSTGVLQAFILTSGFVTTLAVVAGVLWKQGILHEALYWTVTNHSSVPYIFWKKAFLRTLIFIGACLPMIIAAAISCRQRNTLWKGRSAEYAALWGLLITSVIGAAAGARFYSHYYIQIIPPLAILAAPVFARAFSSSGDRPSGLFKPPLLAAALILTVLGFSIGQWAGALHSRPTEAGEYLRAHSQPTDRIFVWGQTPTIYLDAQRPPASRYVVTFPLTGYIFGGIYYVDTHDRIVPGTWENLDQDFKTHPPEFIVDVQENPKNAQYPIRQFPVLARWLQTYKPVATVREGVIYRATHASALKDPGG